MNSRARPRLRAAGMLTSLAAAALISLAPVAATAQEAVKLNF